MNEIKYTGKNVVRMPDNDYFIFEIVLTAVGILEILLK